MCGICGIVGLKDSTIDRNVLGRMSQAIAHRGPDDQGEFVAPGIGLGFRRLAILDLSPSGHQPMTNPKQTVWVTLNGEIYNFQELREDLKQRGYSFRSGSDTEVIVHGYEAEGEKFIERLAGMFALAIWDVRQQRLVLARDRFGKKPIMYAVRDEKLFYASELEALRKGLPDLSIDPLAVQEYFRFGFIPHPRTIYQGVSQLPPAHLVIWQGGQLSIKPYWKLSMEKQERSETEAKSELDRLLRQAVRQRMISDVPLGVFLSGGLDSSIITALMANESSSPVKTFSIGFPDESHNELPLARLVAKKYGTDHHEFMVEPKVDDVLPGLMRHFGQPFADSSAVAVWYVARETRQHVTVALNGDGGDENFAGYEKYALLSQLQKWGVLPKPIRQALWSVARPLLERTNIQAAHKFQVAGQFFADDLVGRYIDSMFMFTSSELSNLLPLALPNRANQLVEDRLRGLPSDASLIDNVTALDLRFYLPDGLMTKADIATMANSLEGRSPFLDHRLVEFTATLQDNFKIRAGQRKWLLRETFGHLLPSELLTAKKRGFDLPVNQWLKQPLLPYLRSRLNDPQLRQTTMFNWTYIDRLIDEHASGRRHHGIRLWSLLCFAVWYTDVYQS